MKERLTIALALVSILLPVSCGQKVTPDETPVSIVPRTPVLSADEGTLFVAVTASGSWTVTLEYPEETEPWAVIDPDSGTGSRADVRLRYPANPGSYRSVTLVLRAGGVEAKAQVSQNGETGHGPGKADGNGYGAGYGYDTTPAGLDWLELPATTASDGCELLIHNMNGGRYMSFAVDGTRNWTCYWDYEEHLSPWVAYPLNAKLYGSGKFSYVWGFDPLISDYSLQPDITERSYGGRDFSGSNWNRGHQMPRADRQTSQNAVASTCYPTNMTPQDGQFNSGVWAALESKVRDYARSAYESDTLFVVTGCMYMKSNTYTDDRSGYSVRVPTHYFKALLLAGHNAQDAVEKDGLYYKGVAFLLPHSPDIEKQNYVKYMMSIDKLEAETGFDFFPNLVKRLGQADADKVEAAAPSSWWK